MVARSEDSNRATAPQCRNQQSSGLLVSPRESPRGMGKGAERAGGRDVAATQPYGKRKALFYCYNPESRAGAPSEDENSCEGDRRLRRKQGARAGAAVAEDKPRPKGRRPMRAPQLVRRHRSAGTNSPVDCWLARGRVPGEWEREQSVPGVEMLPLRSLTENVRLFFYCYNPGCRGSLCTIGDEDSCGGDRRLRRKQGAVAGAARRNPRFAIISHL